MVFTCVAGIVLDADPHVRLGPAVDEVVDVLGGGAADQGTREHPGVGMVPQLGVGGALGREITSTRGGLRASQGI